MKTTGIKVDEFVQVQVRRSRVKRGKWFSPRRVISVDTTAGIITHPGFVGKKIIPAVEDNRATFSVLQSF